jgi:HTH-type transcriptional regulator, competence development regulator
MNGLKELRKRSSLTLREIEERTGISNAYLSQLENGKIKSPSAQVLYNLSIMYGITLDEIFFASGLLKKVEIDLVMLNPSLEQRVEALERICKNINPLNRNFKSENIDDNTIGFSGGL